MPYYGAAAGKQLAVPLRDHILIAARFVGAALAQDSKQMSAANAQWHKNAQEITLFLTKANPYWPEKTLVAMLNQYLALTLDQTTARLRKQWQTDITLYDQIRSQLSQMADALSDGIVKQFPEKFQ